MNKPIFILGCTKSGTTLMRNLFDGHPSLFVIPTEAHFFQNSKYWVDYYFRRTKPENLSFDEIKQNLIHWITYQNSIKNTIADGFSKNRWNIELLEESIQNVQINSMRELSDLYVRSMYKSLMAENIPNGIRFVEKSVENTELALDWLNLYPDAYYIHILRNPYSNIVAIRKYLNTKKFPDLSPALYALKNTYYNMYKNIRLIKKMKIVIYEDLISNPLEIMKEISDFASIEFNKAILTPTLFGKTWGGNSTSGKKFDKISNTNLNLWKESITDFEIMLINKYFQNVLQDFNFEIITPKKSIYYPNKHESLKSYCKNRILFKTYPELK